MLTHWKQCVPNESILVAYGGPADEFDAIPHKQKFFTDDPRLRTRDHQRESQSYTRLFQAAAECLRTHADHFNFVYFAEYDHIPLIPDLNEHQIERAKFESADVLAFHLHRVDGTSNPHFLYHVAHREFTSYWRKISLRSDPEIVLSMFGSGSFWTRQAFCAVANFDEPFPVYMELYLPTLAHHLGFRVRDLAEQNQFVRVLEREICSIDQARAGGAWTLHPVKQLDRDL